jgi:uncharacterized protein YcfJ
MKHIDPRAAGALAIVVALAGCVAPPTAPTIPVVPGAGKTPEAFNADMAVCQQYAYSQTAPVAAAANNQAVGSTLLTTALGAAIGGAAGGGRGAGIGAASGAAFGTVGNAVGSGWGQLSLQQQYDALYASCMAGRGNQVPNFASPAGMPAYGGPPPGYGPQPSYGPPPGY